MIEILIHGRYLHLKVQHSSRCSCLALPCVLVFLLSTVRVGWTAVHACVLAFVEEAGSS